MADIVPTKHEIILQTELAEYVRRTTKSAELHAATQASVPGGIASDYQVMDPYPFYVGNSNASSIVDVDGNNLIDFHGGFGVTLFGYKHPYLIEAANKVFAEQGSLISLPTPYLLDASKILVERFSLPFWRFFNSGTEATLDAIRLARARYTRKYVIKIESGYHGHHDAVWVSVHAGAREVGSENPSVPFCSGIPKEVSDLTLIAEFNNLDSVKKYLAKYPEQIAAVIVEPILLNCSMIKPKDGFLQQLIELCRAEKVAVIFDLVKINTAIHMKHIIKYWDNENCGPDLYTLGKGLSGAMCPVGAIGMTAEFAALIPSKVQLSGTYCGNSFALGMVTAVQNYATESRQDTLETMSKFMHDRVKATIDKHKLPAIVEYVGNKGCITFFKKGHELPCVRHYQDYIRNVDLVLERLFTVFMFNRGLWVQPRDEWSVSYQHTQSDAEAFVDNFELFASTISEA